MADKTIKRVVKLEAQFAKIKDFGSWIAGIEKEMDTAVDKSFAAWIKEYKGKLEALGKSMSSIGPNPSDGNIALMQRAFKDMEELSKKIAKQFSKIDLGDASAEIEKAAEKVQDAMKAQRRAKEGKRDWTRRREGASGLSNTEVERLYNSKVKKSGITVNGKKYGGADGLGSADFVRDFQANSKAFTKLKEALDQRIKDIQDKINFYTAELNKATKAQEIAEKELSDLKSADIGTDRSGRAIEGFEKAGAIGKAGAELDDQIKADKDAAKAKNSSTEETKKYNEETKKTPNLVKKAATQVFAYATVVNLFKRMLNSAKHTIIELDRELTNMAVVTSMTREEAWQMVGTLQEVARATGATSTEVAATVTKFLQQGKSVTQALQLSEAALMGAKIAGIDASRSVDLLTNAMNGFQMSASQALEVSDKFAALAAASATDYEELAVALSKVAAQANLAGMSMDFTLGMLAKGIEVTREAPETIGTALKTVISRMRELTDYGETLEEGTDVNRVEKALDNVGVKLRDTNGQFRNLEDVLTELGGKWNTLNVNQQANVAVALAGTRQQSRLIAMMQDFDRTLELVDISTNSYGATMAQHAEYMGSLQAATDGLKTSYEGFINSLTNSEVIVSIVKRMSQLVDFGTKIVSNTRTLVPLLILLSNYGLGILSNKIRENQYERANNKLAKEKQKNQNKIRLNEIAIRKTLLQQYIQNLKDNKVKEDGLELTLEEAAVEAEKNGNIALALGYRKKIGELSKDDTKETLTLREAQLELNALEQEEINLKTEQNLLSYQQVGLMGGLNSSLFGSIGLLSTIVMTIGQAIISTKQLIAAKKAEEVQTKKNTAAVYAEAAGRKIAAAFGMASSASWVPYVGWAIGLGIIAAILGTVIAIGAAAKKTHDEKEEQRRLKSIEGNIEAVQKLQAEIYNLSQSVKTVGKIADEFDTLARKINKSAEDVKRLKELITEFNDEVGFKAISESASASDAMTTMRGYEAFAKLQLQQQTREALNLANIAINSADDLQDYMRAAGGSDALKQIIAQNSETFAGATDLVQTMIMDSIENNAEKFINAAGDFSVDLVSRLFTDSVVAALDEGVKSGSFESYADSLTEITGETNTLNIEVLELIKNTDTLYAKLARFSGKERKLVGQNIDALGLSETGLEYFNDMIAAELEKTGGGLLGQEFTNAADVFAQMFLNYQNELKTSGVQQTLNNAIATRDQWLLQNKAEFDRLQELAKAADASEDDDVTISKEDRDKLTMLQKESGDLQTAVKEAEKTVELAGLTMNQAYNLSGIGEGIGDLQDTITKSKSAIEQFQKIVSGEIEANDLNNLLTENAKLVGFMEDRKLSAAELLELTKEQYDITKKELEIAEESARAQALNILKNDYGFSGADFNKITDGANDYQELMAMIGGKTEKEQKIILGAWSSYMSTKMLYDNFVEKGLFTDEQWEKIGENTGFLLAKSQYEAYKKEAETYATNEDGYATALLNAANAAGDAFSAARFDKNNVLEKLKTELRTDQFEIINGELFYKYQGQAVALSALDSIMNEEEALGIRTLFMSADAISLVEAYQKADDEILENAQNAADAYLEIQNQKIEQEKEALDKKKASYEDYFESIDKLEEDADRAISKESIIRQLSSLSTGVNGTSKTKMKELQQQLKDLEQEEKEAQKEEMRNSLLEKLDEEAQKLNESLKELENTLKVVIRTMLGENFVLPEGQDMWSYIQSMVSEAGYSYSSGGLATHTGLAMLHGTPNRPEMILNAETTALLSSLLSALNFDSDRVGDTSNIETNNTSSNVTIENISIQAQQLNNAQDFSAAGNALAREFAKIIQERGLTVNARK